jgi:flagellar basal body-associated protein FliL
MNPNIKALIIIVIILVVIILIAAVPVILILSNTVGKKNTLTQHECDSCNTSKILDRC